MNTKMKAIVGAIFAMGVAGTAMAGEFGSAHDAFRDGFNNRDWDAVKSVMAEDMVFHRAGSADVYIGRDAVVGRFEATIAGEWNVKFTKLDTTSEFEGKDGRVVERGDFAITAGADSNACYIGSYLMTWAPESDGWKMQVLTWQDLETALANC